MIQRRLLFSLCLLAPGVAALEPVGEPGWSGYVNLGASGGQVESNLLSEIGVLNVDLGDADLGDYGSPGGEDVYMPVADFDLGYTLSNGRTRIMLSNDASDIVRFDRSTAILVQHDTQSAGSVELGLFSASEAETRVWEDPYQLDGKRDDTELGVTGLRLVWDRILGTGFQTRISYRERDLDDERSGQSLGLDPAERELLDRNGDIVQAEFSYRFPVGAAHSIRPHVRYVDRDLDGGAMAQDGFTVGVIHEYASESVFWQGELRYSQWDSKKENPIFSKNNDVDRVYFTGALLFPGAFGWTRWVPNISVVYAHEDSEIAFYDAKAWLITAAVMRTF